MTETHPGLRDDTEVHLEALGDNQAAISLRMRRWLEARHHGRFVLQSHDDELHLEQFGRDGHCELEVVGAHPEIATEWRGEKRPSVDAVRSGFYGVGWRDESLMVVVLTLQGAHCEAQIHYIVGDEPVARAFFEELARWSHEVREEVLVFRDGHWTKNADLFRSLQDASFDDLVLAGDLRERLVADFDTFVASRDRYEELGIPWKRGVILTGPPGNGKTHCVKAIVRHLDLPCLYVRSFESKWETPQACIDQAFRRTRETAPCVLVLEDLDTLVNEQTRSFFLNELDGFAQNTGIIVVATSNYPEKLDPAILDRPSRFDVKYAFDLPAAAERRAFLAMWSAKLPEGVATDTLDRAARGTEGFSFAYLKELYVSALMRWGRMGGSLDEVLLGQIQPLRAQLQ